MSPSSVDERAQRVVPLACRILTRSWRRHRRAESKAPWTIWTYTERMTRFATFLVDRGMSTDPTRVTELIVRHKPALFSDRSRVSQSVFRWIVEEGETAASQSAKLIPPVVPRRGASERDRRFGTA